MLVAGAAAPLTHLARFQQFLNLRTLGSSDPELFTVGIKPINGASHTTPSPLSQKFKYVFDNIGDEDLNFTVIVLGHKL
ncbi:hypothetical protein V8C42DRAFT_308435 [Trichoderma barbatum]